MLRERIWRWITVPKSFKEGKQSYYDPRSNRLFCVIHKGQTMHVCSGFTDYYRDSTTNISRQILSKEFVDECTPIQMPLDKEPLLHYDGIGWRVAKATE